jgi:hypothetical protein
MAGDSAYASGSRQVLEEYEERFYHYSLLSRQVMAASSAAVTTVSGWYYNRLWSQRSYSKGRIAGLLAVCSLTSGSVAVLAWEYLVTRPVNKEQLLCPVCVAVRGSAVAVLGGVVLPGILGPLGTRIHSSHRIVPGLARLFFYGPKPLGTAGVIFMSLQAALGYLLAGKQVEIKLEETLIRRKIVNIPVIRH